MNVRSITVFVDASFPLEPASIRQPAEAAQRVKKALIGAGYAVQTTRLAIQPLAEALGDAGAGQAVELAQELEQTARDSGIDYVSCGPVRLFDPDALAASIPDVLARTQGVFVSLEIAAIERGLSLPRARQAAEIILRTAALAPDGSANLRLAALANVKPWSPFFPAAYHGGGALQIALATESADVAVEAFSGASTLAGARAQLIRSVEDHARRLESAAGQAGVGEVFRGIDFSLAPGPQAASSIAHALERLGLPAFGQPGTLAASAFVTSSLDQARFKRTGFCGLMLPVLEDGVLSARVAEQTIGVNDLLICSAVCGTGLDTLPLPGDVPAEVLAGILCDVGALALRLGKPLTARLVPLPGKQAGDAVSFDFENFAPGRVMRSPTRGPSGLLAGDEALPLTPRQAPL